MNSEQQTKINNGFKENSPENNKQEVMVNSDTEELLRIARRKDAEYEQELLELKSKERARAKKELEWMAEKRKLLNKIDNVESKFENFKVEAVLNKEMQLEDKQEIKLSPKDESKRILADVIRKRKERAEDSLNRKNDNIFFQ